MHRTIPYAATLVATIGCSLVAAVADTKVPAEKVLDGIQGVRLIVRAQGPYDADVPLQVVCYFKHKPEGDKTLGAAVELDKRLGGVIASLRNRGEFLGDEQETFLLTPTLGTIKPKLLLLIGLGEERALSLNLMERVGRIAQRQASRLGVRRVAFAPLLRDQGNNSLSVGDVETAVIRGVLLAQDTDKRLQKEGLTKDYSLEDWIIEAGPAYFDETVKGVEKGVAEAKQAVANRSGDPYTNKKQ